MFQWPVHAAISAAYGTTEAAEVFVFFCICLWVAAGVYAEYLEAAFVGWLRGRTSAALDGRSGGGYTAIIP